MAEKQKNTAGVEQAMRTETSDRDVPDLSAKIDLMHRLSQGRITRAGIARGLHRDGSVVTQWAKNGVPPAMQVKLAHEMNVSVENLLLKDFNEFTRRMVREYEFGSGTRWRMFRQDLEFDQNVRIHLMEQGQSAVPDGYRGMGAQQRKGGGDGQIYRFHCNAGVNLSIQALAPWRDKGGDFNPREWVIVCYDRLDYVTSLCPSHHFEAPALVWPDATNKPRFPVGSDQLIYVTAPPAGEQFILVLALGAELPEKIRQLFMEDQCNEALDRMTDWLTETKVNCASAQTSFFVIP